jgi:DedD protein
MAWFKFGKKDGSVSTQAPLESVEAMRQRAKHRLIGSVVLVLAGVVGFPLLFDSQPRPVAVDIPIEIPDKAKVKPLGQPSTPSAPAPAAKIEDKASLSGKEEIISSGKPDAKTDDKQPPAQDSTARPATKSVATGAATAAAAAAAAATGNTDDAQRAKDAAEKAKADKAAADKAKLAEAEKARKAKADADASRAKALLDGSNAQAKPATSTPEAAATAGADGERYIVQFGAFSDVAKAREVRQKVEKAGLKTYSQVAKTADGDRIRVRVGPFTSRAEADKAAAKIKALDLPASILTL